ncbi:MAG: hypothetical protein NTV86_23435 [Planctomycetota bacterium]|nr:hypothetical protein [Planctomycetota bacterium]
MNPTRTAVSILFSLALALPAAAQTASEAGMARLIALLKKPAKTDQVIATLGVIADPDLAPLLAGACAGGPASQRLTALSALARLGPEAARGPLLACFQTDPDPIVKGKALALLLNLKAVEPAEIRTALRLDDPHVRCLAARALVAAGKGSVAIATLNELAADKATYPDPKGARIAVPLGVSAMSRLALLAAGEPSQLAPLQALIRDRKQPAELRQLLSAQITRDKITVALPLARELVDLADDDESKLLALESVSAASPNDPTDLIEAVKKSTGLLFRIRLVELLAVRPDAPAALSALADQTGPTADVIAFERSRAALDQTTTQAALKAIADEQPVTISYVLSRARKDVDQFKARAACYLPVLVKCIQLAGPETRDLLPEHHRAGRAAAMLADIGTPEALAALKGFLPPDKYDNRTRAVAAGLLESKSPAACDAVAPLLTSVYPELAWRAGVILGLNGRESSRAYLTDIVTHPDQHPDEKLVMAAWFLAKLDRTARPWAVQIGQMLRTATR